MKFSSWKTLMMNDEEDINIDEDDINIDDLYEVLSMEEGMPVA
ncbi:hypothetical protein A2U01_0090315 [Trifolium medium]|uniref:Uncharacterized protein n=1 Tax=Trifolium medium TaxID=97028 RepID=A0A392U8C8_9FABA|nr:hypothetical protein [Trifolium medium]